METKNIVKKIQLSDTIEFLAITLAFITLKDYKDTFQSSLPCRLINPSKSKLGKISKTILENIIQYLNSCALTNGNILLALQNGLKYRRKEELYLQQVLY